MKKSSKLLIELITLLEELEWQYSITHEDYFEIYLGEILHSFSKFNEEKLEQMIVEVENA